MFNWESKHSEKAYEGKMNRLLFSKILEGIIEKIYDLPENEMKEEYSQGEQLLALQDKSRCEAFERAVTIVEETADRVLNCSKEDMDWYWNIKKWNNKN